MGVKERPFCRFWIGPTVACEQCREFLLLENGNSIRSENWRVLLFNCKDGVKDCLKLPSYDLTGARSPIAWILDPTYVMFHK
jgi:hypothetical protein